MMSVLYLLAGLGMVAACQPRLETQCQPGFILTGGYNSPHGKKAEVWNPVNQQSCPLPDLPEEMWGHSHCGNLLCSGKSCLKMTSTGSFSPAPVSFLQARYFHLCWSLPGERGEVMLLGVNSSTTTDVISSNFESKPSWDLKYKTGAACGVEVDDKFVITGGWDHGRALNSVVRYNPQGESEVLPSLTVARWGHACAGYLNGDGERVVLVTGGGAQGGVHFDSTELMVEFKPWRPAANLPSPRFGPRAASLADKVFLFGGQDISGSGLESILSYEPESDTWHEAGNMTVPRYYHAVAVFP